MTNIKCKGCAHYKRTPIAVNDIGGGAYETDCGLGKEDEFFTEEGCEEYEPREDKSIASLSDAVRKSFELLTEQRDYNPRTVFMGELVAMSLKNNYPEVWKDFTYLLRHSGANLVLLDAYGGGSRAYNLKAEVSE